ncbi:MAG TPA: helicase-related protein, partial [Gemmatimonadaceae bacterium]|nr:helicase-related protein [Gemmatimonadaceae bacterium]
GKTYVALALAREARAALVVAPAALRATWTRALRRTGVHAPFVSTERLGRLDPPTTTTITTTTPGAPHDLVIVDEAHHFRNPRTHRHARLASLVRHARALLLSATPVHNRRSELDALLALFLGSRAAMLDEADRARLVVRRGHDTLPDAARPPRALPPRVIRVPLRDGVTERILAIPSPVPASDGGVAGALVAHELLRLWASSAGALRAGLRRRLVRAEALLAALDAGHHLSRTELERWAVGDDVVQLGFPELLDACDGHGTRVDDATPTADALRAHATGVREALAALGPESDDARATALRRLRRRHAGERIVAFTQFAGTVRSYFGALRRDGGVCALTSREALVAGGRMSRAEALRRFAPLAHGAAEPPAPERVTLLVSTDVASEGIDLTDASVVVHLDLPWTPTRLEQRVGRLTRLGSPHAAIAVYALAPPVLLRALVGIERALRAKWSEARRTVGASGVALPPAAADDERAPHIPGVDCASRACGPGAPDAVDVAGMSVPEASELLRAMLAGWPGDDARPARASRSSAPTRHDVPPGAPLVAAAEATGGGTATAYLALVSYGERHTIIAGSSMRTPPSDDPRLVLRVARAVPVAGVTREIEVEPRVADAVLAAVSRWVADRQVRSALGAVGPSTLRLQRRLLARIAAAVRDAPLHRRSRMAAAAAAARRTLARPLP